MFTPEIISLPFDWNTLICGAGLGAAALASVFSHEHDTGSVDLNAVKNRVDELEKTPSRTLEQNDELAALYSVWATTLYDNGADLDEIAALFGKAEAILKATLAQGDDTEVRRQLGNVYLNRAVTYNDYDDLESAVDSYQKAIETLKPLDDSGDGEAKYDIAGVKLNLGIVHRELGNYEQARTSLDEAFLAYRAVEKIGVFDTRFYMAKVSVQQGGLLYEMGESLDKITDAYNRAMRLYVEVIEDEQRFELERDLANALLDRCMATYEDYLVHEFASEEEKEQKNGDVLIDIKRGIELLEKQSQEGNEEARYDLFHGVSLQGKVLCDLAKYDEAKKSLDRAVNEFSDLCKAEDDVFLMQMAMVYANRAVVQMGLGNKELSKQDCQKGSELINTLIQSGDYDDEDIKELKEQFQMLLDQLK